MLGELYSCTHEFRGQPTLKMLTRGEDNIDKHTAGVSPRDLRLSSIFHLDCASTPMLAGSSSDVIFLYGIFQVIFCLDTHTHSSLSSLQYFHPTSFLVSVSY